ncbi:hypothetical protein DY000_02015671 [Brassica cretica]|uniref:Uncharacterized protein n=1 Tax=Brassica cretica TaxID=69181 RepID=A0ABQ7D524_BRACR|nr:hypothetical protein DY000_02015671 [Brassica cretica]
MRLMNFVMLQELMKQLTNFKSSEAMWTSSIKLGGAEVKFLIVFLKQTGGRKAWRKLRTDETERIHMRLMNFVMLQELMKQLTNFKSSEAMWTSSIKLGGAEVQSPKTRDGITTNENGDHEYVEYNNSSTTSPCQDHSPWLSA